MLLTKDKEKYTKREVLEELQTKFEPFKLYIESPIANSVIPIGAIDTVLLFLSGDKEKIKEFWMRYYNLTPEMFSLNVDSQNTHYGCLGKTIATNKPCRSPCVGSSKGLPPYRNEKDFYCIHHLPEHLRPQLVPYP